MAGEDDERDEAGGALRSVSERLGGWARRVGELVADAAGRPVVPEALREPLADARKARLAGRHAEAYERLRNLLPQHGDEPHLRLGIGITLVYDLLAGGRPIKALGETIEALDDTLGSGPLQLLRGARALYEGRPEPALDELRRAAAGLDRLPDALETECRFLLHLLAALSHLRLGNEERALRELRKARARMPVEAGSVLRGKVLERGVDLSLASGEIADAEAWIRETLTVAPDDRRARELLCRTLACKGDRVGAHALLEELGDDGALDETRLWVGLTVGLPEESEEDLRAIALRYLQQAPEDLERRRIWALVELQRTRGTEVELGEELRRQMLEALVAVCADAPRATRDRYLQELAHVALRLGDLSETVHAPIADRLARDEGTAPEELRLVRAWVRLAKGEDASADFIPGPIPRFRADPDIGGPWGPDPRSPVRNPSLRMAVLSSQRCLAAAELALARGEVDVAPDLLVEALIEWPELRRARALLAEIGHPPTGARLEDLLASATSLLASVPNRVLGISLSGVQDALAKVVAARERLARPLAIAIMGEFSAGKSTFVNALLGEEVAPMGVLPTTTTINVFRRGPTGGARVHYRDGRIATLDPDEVHKFLHGLDSTEASRIRHVEIERTGSRMGDAAVVDTPGLNALDPYHEQVAREFLDEADAVVWVFSATRSGAASEVGMLSSLRASGRQVLGVLNKVDTLDEKEQQELSAYLREQLGEVLVDVVPLRGREALEHRIRGKPSEDDPFAAVEAALETHFLQRARELKRSLTARRLGEALAMARKATLEGIEALESRASAAQGELGADASETAVLAKFADAVREEILDVDDTLTREGLAIGILQTKKGMLKGPLDPLDAEYLAACFRDGCMAALQRALAGIAAEDPVTSEVLDRVFVPWARGNVEGLLAADFIPTIFATHGAAIAQGEGPMRAALRSALQPVAAAWADHARHLVYVVEQARMRARRRAISAPRAEALRLRTGVLTAIDALAHATGEVQA